MIYSIPVTGCVWPASGVVSTQRVMRERLPKLELLEAVQLPYPIVDRPASAFPVGYGEELRTEGIAQ